MAELTAGDKVKVQVLGKGVLSIRDAEVLSVQDGLVHVQMDGEAVSIDPSQIVPADAPVAAAPVASTPELENAVADVKGQFTAALTEMLQPLVDRVTALEVAHEKTLEDLGLIIFPLQDRVTALEAKLAAENPLAPADPAPAPMEQPNEESTSAAASGETAAGS